MATWQVEGPFHEALTPWAISDEVRWQTAEKLPYEQAKACSTTASHEFAACVE
jgi:hypothetical protein